MCGIAGIYNFNDKAVEQHDLQQMAAQMAFRGPDHEGILLAGKAGFAHRRLSIIDLSELANQPMQDKSTGVILVFNGAIYNYPELRRELIGMGHSFSSQGDTEVILRAYLQWGESFVSRLHGMFAFSLFDPRQQLLLLFRDRLGIKPLYFSHHHKRFMFASNMQALLTQRDFINTEINPRGLHHQLTLHAVIPAPDTIIKGVSKLAPGHMLKVSADGKMTTTAYWKLPYTRDADKLNWGEQEWTEAIEASLTHAIEKRMQIADVPVGVLLSGGLDSSLLVALLKNHGVENLQTFSIGFNDIGHEKGSEFEFSDQVVARYGTQHHKIHIPNEDVLARLPDAVAHMAEPMVGQDAVAFYLLSEQVAKHVKVVQSGQGADELFGGYFWYPQMQQAHGSQLRRFCDHYCDRDYPEYRLSVTADYQDENYTEDHIAAYFKQLPDDRDFLNKVLHLDVTTLIVDDPVKRVDNMTMAWSLEARVPFLDHHLVELAMQMPACYKVGTQGGKHILKNIARGKIPDAVIDRPKGYFPMPALKYVRGDFLDMMSDLLESQACVERGLYNRNYVRRLIKMPEHPMNMTRLQGSKLWHMALLEMWLQQNKL